MDDKIVLGNKERVQIGGKTFWARIDTGAQMSSIDRNLAEKLSLGPIVRTTEIRSANGSAKRPVVRSKIFIKEKALKASFNLADRNKMTYPILIGRNILRKGFLVDASK